MTKEELELQLVELKQKLKEQEIQNDTANKQIKQLKEDYKVLQAVNNKLVLIANAEPTFKQETKKEPSYDDLINKIKKGE